MKKQLIIAAVATTMSVSALADISITGAASATWTATDYDSAATANTNVYSQDTDITITGTSGETTVSTSIDLGASTDANVGDVTMATTLMGVDVTVTDDGGVTDFKAVTDIAGVTLTFDDSNTNKNGTLKGAMTLMGLDVSVSQSGKDTDTSVGGDLGGITATYNNYANDGTAKNTNSIEVSGTAAGLTLTATNYSADSAAAAWLDKDGDDDAALESDNGTSIAATVDLGGNSVTVTSSNFKLASAVTVDKVTIAGTRALASGADLTATYTNDDVANKSTIALKIAVSF